MRVKLIKKSVEAVAPDITKDGSSTGNAKARDVIAWDLEVPRFAIKVTPSGKRSYFVYYRTTSGQQLRPKVGDHGALTVDQAR